MYIKKFNKRAGRFAFGFAAGLMALTGMALAGNDPVRPIAINQTDGYGDAKLVAFTYFQNFSCIHEPFADLDRNGKKAAADPDVQNNAQHRIMAHSTNAGVKFEAQQ